VTAVWEQQSFLDDDAGAVVRPYALTRGRTRPDERTLELIALVSATDLGRSTADRYAGEHQEILRLCRSGPVSVAELSAYLDVPLGVGRVLVSDLLEQGMVAVRRPGPRHLAPDLGLLERVRDGLLRL
jgi:hypothetical protein